MTDNAVITTVEGRPAVHIKAGSLYVRFTDAGSLADWLAAHPRFTHQDIHDRFLAALDEAGAARRPETGGSVNDALAMVADLNARRRTR